MSPRTLWLWSICLLLPTFAAAEQLPRELPAGQLPNDVRLKPLKDYDGYFPFTVPKSVGEWNVRRERVIRQILVSQGLWPLPTKTPLNPVIHGKVDRGDYTVEKVFFESHPGFFVTGSLYRPVGKTGPRPAILCPHGHWNEGRFHDAGEANVKKEIVIGAERFLEGGRTPLQARCVQLARMGCVVFHYDMLGNADSQQFSHELVHRFKEQRPAANTLENWGLYGTQAEANLQSIMGFQTWNSIRSLDFMLTLPDVDPQRIGVTGASGGGTQTMILAAIDPRVAFAFPAVMVSTAMQGGCTCESSCLLRVETGNIEFAALFAPKPQGMTSANDWTKEMPTKGFPELQQLYKLLGAEKDVTLVNGNHFGHNYNYVSRSAMYGLVNKYFKLGLPEPVIEEDCKRLSKQEMSVWDAEHPQPPSGEAFERKLLAYCRTESQQALLKLVPKDANGVAEFQKVVGGGIDVLIGRGLPEAKDVSYDQTEKIKYDTWIRMSGLLRTASRGEELPITFCFPKEWKKRVVIWVTDQGKNGLFQPNGEPREEVRKLVAQGTTVVGVDLLYQGEFLESDKPYTTTGKVKNPREFAGYTFGYNHTVFAQRVHDLLSTIVFVKNYSLHQPEKIDLFGRGDIAGPLVAAARAQAKGEVDRAVIDTANFRFGKLTNFHDVRFLPGGAKYLDLPGLLAVAAPHKTWVAGETDDSLAVVKETYQATGNKDKLKLVSGDAAAVSAGLLEVLLAQ